MLELGHLRLVNGEERFIQVLNGNTYGITENPVTENWVDCNNNLAIPGLIDPHVHAREDQPEKETAEALDAAAILGGVALVAKMPNTKVPATTCEIIVDRAGVAMSSHLMSRYWIGATNGNYSELDQAFRRFQNYICGVKVYMGSSTGNLLVNAPRILRIIFGLSKLHNVPTAVHAEDEAMMQRNFARFGGDPAIGDHCKIRDTAVEVSAVRTALALQADIGNVLYFCHISSPESLELIMDAKQGGRTVHAEVCPHHLCLMEDLLLGREGGKFKMNPPLRTQAQVEKMRRYVCTPGWVDTIGSDHAPHHPSEKIGQDYARTASGVPGLQTILPLMFNFVREGEMSLDHFVNITSLNAARILNLPKWGIRVGSPANITVINDTEMRAIRDRDMATLWKWTPFDGMAACGFPSHVVTNGRLVYPTKYQQKM